MHPRQSLPPEISARAEQRAGLLARQECLRAGVSPKALIRLARDWVPLGAGLYALGLPTWQTMAWAALARGGAGAVLGGAAAAFLHGLLRDAPDTLTCWLPDDTRPGSFGFEGWNVRYRRGMRPGWGTLARSSVERTLVDLAGEASADTVVSAVTRGFVEGRTTPQRLLELVEHTQRVPRRHLLTRLCERSARGIESALEWRFDASVIRPHRLPAPKRQVVIEGRRVDLIWADYAVIAELDGRRDHEDWSKDMMRDNAHALLGHTTLRYGWASTCFQPCAVAAQLADVLKSKGWTGRHRHCGSC